MSIRSRRLAIASASLVASLVLAEIALRRSVPEWTVFHPPVSFRPDLFEEAPFGYRLHPGRVLVYPYPRQNPRRVTVHANREGFRNRRDFSDPDARPRIVVVGDSMVFGPGVEESERFTEIMEAAHPEWRVDNLGMVGFGTDLMLRAFETAGLAPRPRVAVVAVFTDDLRRVVPPYAGMGFRLPRFELVGDHLATVPYPEPRFWESSLLFQGMRYAWWRYTSATFRLNEALLDRFLRVANDSDVELVVMYLPPRRPRWDDERRRDLIASWAGRNRVPFLDASAAIAREGSESSYIAADGHFDRRGHAVVARELSAFLETGGMPLERAP